jgi:sugar-specific transcriptional regulator TrmB/DNA-binding CsgD family transcriptional regulator
MLGIPVLEEEAYLCLLDHPRATTAEIAGAMNVSPRKAQELLDAIEAKGLATHMPERPRRYVLAAPDIAMESLVLQREKDLQRIRGVIKQLQERAAARAHTVANPIVELITHREAERQVFNQMQASAQQEVIFLVRPPILISRREAQPARDESVAARARGVRYRGIVDAEYLALPGAVEHVRDDIGKGDEVRTVAKLPFKMVLVDRRVALIPLDLESSSSEVLLARSSALLDALHALFETLWSGALPLSELRGSGARNGLPGESVLPEGAEELLELMAAGLNDKAIAHELRLSIRTLNRRIAELAKALNVRTRFQIGWLAARRKR